MNTVQASGTMITVQYEAHALICIHVISFPLGKCSLTFEKFESHHNQKTNPCLKADTLRIVKLPPSPLNALFISNSVPFREVWATQPNYLKNKIKYNY